MSAVSLQSLCFFRLPLKKTRKIYNVFCVIGMIIAMVICYLSLSQIDELDYFRSENSDALYLVTADVDSADAASANVALPITNLLKGNKHIKNRYIISQFSKTYSYWVYNTFVRLDYPESQASVVKEMNERLDKMRAKSQSQSLMYKGMTMKLVPEKDVLSKEKTIVKKKSDMDFALSLFSVALLLVASISFITVSMTEVPSQMKKLNTLMVLGVTKGSIRRDIIFRNLTMSGIALLATIFIIALLNNLGILDNPLSKSISITDGGNRLILAGLILYSFLTGLLSGFYPAIYSTHFSLSMILKGRFALSRIGKRLRSIMLSVQFTACFLVMLYLGIIALQNYSLTNSDFKFPIENMVYSKITSILSDTDKERLKNSLAQVPGVDSVMVSNSLTDIDAKVCVTEADGKANQFVVVRIADNADRHAVCKSMFKCLLELYGMEEYYANEQEAEMMYGFKGFDETIGAMYSTELSFARKTMWLAICCIVITLFGVFSITMIERRYMLRNTAIRRVIGMTKAEILMIQLRHYAILLFVSAVIGMTASRILADVWLSSFDNSIAVPLWLYAAVFVMLSLLVFVSVIVQNIRLVGENLPMAIKYEN